MKQVLFLFVLLISNAVHAKELPDGITLSLPVNAMSKPKVHMIFSSPKEFHADDKSVNAFFSGQSPILEFVPKNETVYNWSKIFTANLIINTSISSQKIVNSIVNNIATTGQVKTYHKIFDTKSYRNYSVSTAAIQYSFNGRNEILYMRYFSGPADVSGIQYTEVLQKPLTGEQFRAKISKIEEKFDSMIKIIEF
jgi:hypothetical protein